MEAMIDDGFTFTAHPDDDDRDLGSSILSRFSTSTRDDHQHLCAAVGAMAQELKDQNLPLTPTSYFGATCSSLDRLLSTSSLSDNPTHLIASLTTFLSISLPKVPNSLIKKKADFLTHLLLRIIRLNTISDAGAISGLKCLSHLLIIRKDADWSDLQQLYGAILAFIGDSRPKVRRQSHVCVREILLSFQGSPVLSPASESITKMFERSLLLAGGSDTANEKPKGAQEVLFMLECFKECLPLMSIKYMSKILDYYKKLLELQQPVVTKRVADSLNAICLHPNVEVSAEALLDLLCLLAVSVNDVSVDGMTFTSRLLNVGMAKVYGLNRQICVVKLPLVFTALKDILGSEHEEAIFAATEAFKGLINACVDIGLIKQGVDEITNASLDARKSGPTIIEKVCATIESLLDYQYSAAWDMAFQVVSTMFDKLGEFSSYFMKGTLKNLAAMQDLPDDDFPYRKQLHDCVGSAVSAMGPEAFLNFMPLKLEANDLSEVNVWLFPILKQYTIGARLDFFTETILSSIKLIKQKSQKLELEGRVISSRSADALVYSLWSLLPSFCNYPLDTAESFKDLLGPLCSALRDEPDLHGIICSSLQNLIQQNKTISEGISNLSDAEVSIARQRAIARYTPQIAAANLNVLKSSARELLLVLSRIFLDSAKDEGGCLQSTIGEIASIADKEVVGRNFNRTMRGLLEATQEAGKEKSKSSSSMQVDISSNEDSPSLRRARLFDLAVSLLPGLNAKEVEVLFVAIKPALEDDEGLIQKKAYKVLSIILKKCDWFLSSKLEDLLDLMVEAMPCHFSAKRHRLDCLYFLIVHVAKDSSEQKYNSLSSFLTEIILALKEANKKTRTRAYEVLVQIGHAFGDEEVGGSRENLYKLFNMTAGGLAGETPHMISAVVRALARLAYEFTDLVSTAYNILPSSFLLLQRKNKEITKANLGFIKVLLAKSPSEGLQMHLRSVVEGLLKWQHNTKNHFKAKVKLLLEMLVKKCGLDAVKAVMPEEHMKLLTNIRKINERKERKLAAGSEDTKSRFSKATSRHSRWNHTKIFSDFGEEDTEGSDSEYMDAMTISGRRSMAPSRLQSSVSRSRSKKKRKADRSLPEDLYDQLDDEPLDLLDRQKTRSALRSSEHPKWKQESDDEPEIDPEGRLVIFEEGGKQKKKSVPADPNSDGRSEFGSEMLRKSSKKTQKRRKTSESGWAYTGSEYASKKAAGDVKKKGKLEPYAYWPLDRKMMSRRPEHRAAARKGMGSVVKKLEGKSASTALSMKLGKFKSSSHKKGSKKKSK